MRRYTGKLTIKLCEHAQSEFDFEQSLWTIPAEHNKTGLLMKIHLSLLVKKLFFEIKQEIKSEYALPSIDGKTPLTDKALPKAVARIQDRIGIPQWTPHDLRRTFATQLGETLHIDPVVIEKCLGHKMPKIMATYNKNEMLPQRKEALNQWGHYVENLIKDNLILLNDYKNRKA